MSDARISHHETQVSRQDEEQGPRPCMSRRAFLLSGGAAVTVVALEGVSGSGTCC